MARTDISWTQDEWTELLANECHIKEESARQIAAQLVGQVDIVSFIAALQRKAEKAPIEKQPKTTMENGNPRRQMCNELAAEMCKCVESLKTSAQIVLTSANLYAYLAQRFRKKLIYREAICFLKAKLDRGNKVCIGIYRTEDEDAMNNEAEYALVGAASSFNNFYVSTNLTGCDFTFPNQLSVQMAKWKNNKNLCRLRGEDFENAQLQYFVRLVAQLLQPAILIVPSLDSIDIAILARILNSMNSCVDWVKIDDPQMFLEKPIKAALNKYNKLIISRWTDQEEFHLAFIQWLNANCNGRPKQWNFQYFRVDLAPLLAKIKSDFYRATTMRPFVMYEFIVHNKIGELLGLDFEVRKNGYWVCYTLIRCSIAELNNNNMWMEQDFGELNEMAEIEFD